MTRNGKIARLPREIREELNHRLERNVSGITLVEWLNSLPEVQQVCHDLFDGNSVIPQNLSQWRQGGFAEWQARNDLLGRALDADDTAFDLEESIGLMADSASQLLAARFAIALAEWPVGPDASSSSDEDHDSTQDAPSPPPSVPPSIAALKPLIPLARAISQLRRADRDHAREKREQYHFDRQRSHHEGVAAHHADLAREAAERAAAKAAAAAAAAQASAAPPPSPPAPASKTPAPKSRSHQITPLSPHHKKPRRPKSRPKKAPPPAAASSNPELTPAPTLNPATPLPTDPGPIGPISPISPIGPISPVPSASAPAESDWQLRNRPHPNDPEPAWRILQKTQKTIPPWESADYTPPQTPLKAILARAGS